MKTVQAGIFCLSCSFLLLEPHHRPRQGTKCTSACVSYSTQCTPESFLSCAKSLALSLNAPYEEQGWFLVFVIPQKKCFHCQWKKWAYLCLVACFQTMATSHMPGKSFFCSHMEDWLDELIWLENSLFPTMPPAHPATTPVVAASCFPCLAHYTTWSYRLLGQGTASGLGASFFLCLLEELARNCRQGGEISISRWQINIFIWQIKAPRLLSSGRELSPLKSESMPRSPGKRKVVEPAQNKESFRATVVVCIHSILGSVQWCHFDITVLKMLKKRCQAYL